jgi:hypothetical protein
MEFHLSHALIVVYWQSVIQVIAKRWGDTWKQDICCPFVLEARCWHVSHHSVVRPAGVICPHPARVAPTQARVALAAFIPEG